MPAVAGELRDIVVDVDLGKDIDLDVHIGIAEMNVLSFLLESYSVRNNFRSTVLILHPFLTVCTFPVGLLEEGAGR